MRSKGARAAAVALACCLTIGMAGCSAKTAHGTEPVVTRGPTTTTTGGLVSTTTSPVTIPTAAWISSHRLPLADMQHWPDLFRVALPASDGAFRVEQLCGGTAPSVEAVKGADDARARVDNGANAWSLQQQIIHYPGDTYRMGQTSHLLFSSLQDTLTNCGSTAPDARVEITTPRTRCASVERGGCAEIAAVIESRQAQITAHEYLAVVGSSVTELSVWSSGSPSLPWSAPSDAEMFAAMNPQLCHVWHC